MSQGVVDQTDVAGCRGAMQLEVGVWGWVVGVVDVFGGGGGGVEPSVEAVGRA